MAITLVVEDGTGLSTANTYISASDADLYNANLGRVEWAALDDDVKAAALVKATQFVDASFQWIGGRMFRVQALAWPRHAGLDSSGQSILLIDRDGFDIEGVPQVVQKAVAETAFLSLSNDLFQIADPNGKVIRDKTDVLETEYQPDSPSLKPAAPTLFSAVNLMLRGLYAAPTGGMVIGKAVRG
jgi:hypothetical protein